MTATALRFEAVRRRFGARVALDGVDLELASGSILGLVGRNGAGKTTSLRLAHGVLYPDGGRIEVLGLDPTRDGREVRERVALMSEESALYPWMTVDEIVSFAAALHPRWDPALAERLREHLGVGSAERIDQLSRGNRAKVALVLAVACRPELLLLDDPTAGLDPLVRREVLEGVLETVVGEGGSVVYASHLVHDVERVADDVVVLDGGQVVMHGPLDDLKERVRRATAVFQDVAPAPPKIPGIIDARSEGRVMTVVARGADGDLTTSLRTMGAATVEIETLTLEDILVSVLRDDALREEASGD